ncbi:MAG: hypothetical protein AAGN46_03265 [Acidobacteriota bacterium]
MTSTTALRMCRQVVLTLLAATLVPLTASAAESSAVETPDRDWRSEVRERQRERWEDRREHRRDRRDDRYDRRSDRRSDRYERRSDRRSDRYDRRSDRYERRSDRRDHRYDRYRSYDRGYRSGWREARRYEIRRHHYRDRYRRHRDFHRYGYYGTPWRHASWKDGFYVHYADYRRYRPFRFPKVVVRADFEQYYYGEIWDHDHGHYHDVYLFPTYYDDHVVYRPHVYCENKFIGVGRFGPSGGLHFSVGLNF